MLYARDVHQKDWSQRCYLNYLKFHIHFSVLPKFSAQQLRHRAFSGQWVKTQSKYAGFQAAFGEECYEVYISNMGAWILLLFNYAVDNGDVGREVIVWFLIMTGRPWPPHCRFHMDHQFLYTSEHQHPEVWVISASRPILPEDLSGLGNCHSRNTLGESLLETLPINKTTVLS